MRKRQKVILYNPNAVFYTMPLALVALGSNLDRTRFDVRIVDGRLESDPVSAILSEAEGAVCLGVTVLTGAPLRDALRVSRAVKAHRPELPIVWGGWHPSLFPTESLAEPSVDVTVQGQGEVTFRELVERLAENDPLEGMTGIAYRRGADVVQTAPRPMSDMNELAPHDYNLIPVERYFKLKGRRQLDYIASTGCFWRCAFCADPFVFKRRWTALEPERMVEEIDGLLKHYRFDELSFQDETFFTYRKRVVRLAELFIDRNFRFRWMATMRADQGDRLSDEDFALLKRSGLHRVLIGVESGSQEMVDWMQKDITLEQVMTSAERCVRHGIGGIFPFIVGFPNESDESVQASLDLAKRLRLMSPGFETPFFYFKPYPGSRITQDVEKAGHQLPSTLDDWADFDYIGSAGPWVDPAKFQRMERFKFYNRISGGQRSWIRRPLQSAARWRCKRDFYHLPIEKLIVEHLKPLPKLS